MTKCLISTILALPVILLAIMTTAGVASAQPAGAADDGLRIFKSANCVGCHKWSGQGGGGYGGAAANLRATELAPDQIEETIRCGRPMTGMPHFAADAYTDGKCFGLKAADLPDGKMPPEPDHPLRSADIHAVANYVITVIKGKGDPTFAQCQAFFGSDSRVCNTYANPGEASRQSASPSPDMPVATAPAHLKVETAADANTSQNAARK